jgi:hypothetical protein
VSAGKKRFLKAMEDIRAGGGWDKLDNVSRANLQNTVWRACNLCDWCHESIDVLGVQGVNGKGVYCSDECASRCYGSLCMDRAAEKDPGGYR